MSQPMDSNEFDIATDKEIEECLSLDHPKSFFLYAGAGSGKTRSLKQALESVLERYGDRLRQASRKVGVITFTNAARDEILRRVSNEPIFDVSTIHSFAWTLIEGRTEDIRQWKIARIPDKIKEQQEKLSKARQNHTRERYQKSINLLEKRPNDLRTIHEFTYSPNGDNTSKEALSHENVISICSDFLKHKTTLQKIVIARYPFLLVDESQDTVSVFMDALLELEKNFKGKFALGLFGDTMQRIYPTGMANLTHAIPDYWSRPEKLMNHRSKERIINLANGIRREADGKAQLARKDKAGGYAFAFISPSSTIDKLSVEEKVCKEMATRTLDKEWHDTASVKILTVERHMAAERLGFSKLFSAFDSVPSLKNGFRDGSLASLRLFTERIIPLVAAQDTGDQFESMRILYNHSPLLDIDTLKTSPISISETMQKVRYAVSLLLNLFSDDLMPNCGDILSLVVECNLFESTNDLSLAKSVGSLEEDQTEIDSQTKAWRTLLSLPISQVQAYKDYVSDKSRFETHQGVKGLEFPRVMVIADDNALRFKPAASYEKYFGAKPHSKPDKDKIEAKQETVIDRTRRLLYVTCTRAQESLALVIYSDNPNAIKQSLIEKKLFSEDEILQI